jgi:hypothetical protein
MINNAYVNIEKNKQMIMVRVLERQDLWNLFNIILYDWESDWGAREW